VRSPSRTGRSNLRASKASAGRSRDGRTRWARWVTGFIIVGLVASLVWLVAPLASRRPPKRLTSTFNTVADTWVSTAHPDTNYGGQPTLRTRGIPKVRSYLRFDLHGLSGRVTKATLHLWARAANPAGYHVHPVSDTSWEEPKLVSRNAPAYGTATAASGPVAANTWTTADVTRFVVGDGPVSFALTGTGSQNGTYDSREGTRKPELVVGTRASTTAGAPPQAPSLQAAVENVTAATAYRYGTRDDAGNSMETLKIVQDPSGGYLSVYHTQSNGVLSVKVATSPDLLRWTYRATLDAHASQPALALLSDGGAVLVEEADNKALGSPTRTWLRFRHYPNKQALLRSRSDRSFDAPHTLVPAKSGAEGTPSIDQAKVAPDLDHSTITVGFHYFKDAKADRQASGTLLNFSSWTTRARTDIDAALKAQGVAGNIGDRDVVSYQGATVEIIEAQATTASAWQIYMYDLATKRATPLHVKTHKGSKGFANPSVTSLRAPSGAPALVVTLFLPLSGAAPGEAGELVYYREYSGTPGASDPVIAAAGDIACQPSELVTATVCHQQATSDLLMRLAPAAVLALGDVQYERGQLSNFENSYDRTWGRLKAITHPVVGNHEYLSDGGAGYFDYFGAAAGDPQKGYYSFDLGAWHLIALNSECSWVSGGCGAGSPQERWLRADLAAHRNACTLAYWHQPRFSSGPHPSNPAYNAFWDDLYQAKADVVLVAHDHDYERFAPQDPNGQADPTHGIREFVVGTGGKNHYQFNRAVPNSQVRNGDTFGVLALTLHPTSYSWRFIPEPGKTFTDSGSTTCH
jgi:acid phosphatase type 7